MKQTTPFRSLLALPFGLLVSGCDLAVLPRDQCGNHVIELGEDCDGVGVGSNTCSASCRLDCAVDRSCPPGWGCGADALCRQPSGKVQPFGGSVALPGAGLTLVDFDGDQKSDLLATGGSTYSVAYLGSTGLLPGTATFSVSPLDGSPDVPGVGDLDGDGRADLTLRSGKGLGVLFGRVDRTFLPHPFLRSPPAGISPTDELLAGNFDDRSESPGDELFALRPDGLYLVRSVHPDLAPALPIQVFSWPTGPVPFATVGKLVGNSRPGIVIGHPGDAFVTVYEPFANDPSTAATSPNFESAPLYPPTVIGLPAGATVSGQPVLGLWRTPNSNDYGLADILIPGESGGVPHFYAAFNQDNRVFHSEPNVVGADGAARLFIRTVDGVESTEPILAAAFFSVDVMTDFVTAHGIELNPCNVQNCTAKYTPGGPVTAEAYTWVTPETPEGWVQVRLVKRGTPFGDFALSDVLAVSANQGMTFFKRAASGLFAPFSIPTQAAVERISFGDVNGDGSLDFVFTQLSARATSDHPEVRSLHVSFGDALGIPGDALDLGDVGSCDQLVVANAPNIGEQAVALDDIYARVADGSGDYFVFQGSTDGVIQSPLDLPLVCAAGAAPVGVARASAIGHFDDQVGSDVAVLFKEVSPSGVPAWALWSLHADSNVSEELCGTLSSPAPLVDPGSADLRMQAVDLDADGRDEIVILPVGAPKLWIAKWTAGSWGLTPLALPEPILGMTALELEDGIRDLVLWTGTAILVLWNDKGGALDPGALSSIEITGLPCATRSQDAVVSGPLGVSAVHLRPDAVRDLVVVTKEDTLLVTLDPTTRALSVGSCATDVFEGGGTAATVGDVDGDGVEDVVLARPGGTRVFAGVPVTP